MLLNISKLSIASLVLMSASSLASVTNTTTTNFGSINESYNNNVNFNKFSLTAGGVGISVTGWSDTDNMGNGNPLSGDDKITEAVDFDRNGNGWSMTNGDEVNQNNCGYHHSADNSNIGADGKVCTLPDYDMFLIEFSEQVNLSAATSSWLLGNTNNNQLTVAALKNNNSLAGKDWGQVKNNQTISSGYAGFSQIANEEVAYNSGYYTNSYKADFTTGSANVAGTFSKFWLVGAFNAVFGGDATLAGNDGFKLSGVSFSQKPSDPATSVPEPTSIAMFGLALVGFAATRRKVK